MWQDFHLLVGAMKKQRGFFLDNIYPHVYNGNTNRGICKGGSL